MRNKILILFILGLLACETNTPVNAVAKNNVMLFQMYQEDQADRMAQNIEWALVEKRDSLRLSKVNELLEKKAMHTAQDYYHAAMIFQHGEDTTVYKKAIKMMQKAIAIDSTIDKWLLAAATDRYLMAKGEPQIYGTQYIQYNGESIQLYKIDSSKISDAERVIYGVKTLAEQRKHLKLLNKE